MVFIDILTLPVLLFLVYYVLLTFFIVQKSASGKIKDIEKRNYLAKFQQHITVIVYSQNNSSTVTGLIENLRKQDYSSETYSIYVIHDNCCDHISKLLEIIVGFRLWRINTENRPLGRNKSFAWLLERILTSENTNLFVFMNGDCTVNSDFLSKINDSSFDNPVVLGEILPANEKSGIFNRIFYLNKKINNRVFKHGRYYAKLSNILDNELFAIRQDILEKINFDISDKGFEDYDYSLKLAKAKILASSSSGFCAYTNAEENLFSIASKDYLKRYRSFITFKNNCLILFVKRRTKAKELVLSMIYPSATTFVITLCVLFILSNIYRNTLLASLLNIQVCLAVLGTYAAERVLALSVARLSFKEYKTSLESMLFAPLIYILSFLEGFKIRLNFKIELPKVKIKRKPKRRESYDIVVTDGAKELSCKLETLETGKYAQTFFVFKNKKLASSKQPRLDYALNELIEKLKGHGFAIKICQNCGYFKFSQQDAEKFEGKQGVCLYDNINNGSEASEYTYIWNTCRNIVPAQARDYIMKQMEKKNPKS